MEQSSNVVNLFDDGRQPRESTGEETDARVYSLPDNREQAAYFTALHELIAPSTRSTEDDEIRAIINADTTESTDTI